MIAYENSGISFDDNIVTVSPDVKEQTITIKASAGDINDTFKVTVVSNKFMYKPVDGGYEIDNGTTNYTRPIYYPHMPRSGKR